MFILVTTAPSGRCDLKTNKGRVFVDRKGDFYTCVQEVTWLK